jgi:integrase
MSNDLPSLLQTTPRIFSSDKWHTCFWDWLRSVYAKQRKEQTVKDYYCLWRALMRHSGKSTPLELTRQDIERFIQRPSARTGKPPHFNTVGVRLAGIKSFLKYARGYGIPFRGDLVPIFGNLDPTANITIRLQESDRRAFEVEEAQAFLAAIPRDSPWTKRDYAFFLFALFTGRRLSEIRLMRWEDIKTRRENGKLIHVYTWMGKDRTRKEHLFEMPQACWVAIMDYLVSSDRLERMKPSSAIFVSQESQWKEEPMSARAVCAAFEKYAREAGLWQTADFHDLTTHSFRAAFICDTLEFNGNDLREAALLADHKNILMTERYARKRRRVKTNQHQDALARRYL